VGFIGDHALFRSFFINFRDEYPESLAAVTLISTPSNRHPHAIVGNRNPKNQASAG
jgi:hypothetical protein